MDEALRVDGGWLRQAAITRGHATSVVELEAVPKLSHLDAGSLVRFRDARGALGALRSAPTSGTTRSSRTIGTRGDTAPGNGGMQPPYNPGGKREGPPLGFAQQL